VGSSHLKEGGGIFKRVTCDVNTLKRQSLAGGGTLVNGHNLRRRFNLLLKLRQALLGLGQTALGFEPGDSQQALVLVVASGALGEVGAHGHEARLPQIPTSDLNVYVSRQEGL
jgi:hypothetical protein